MSSQSTTLIGVVVSVLIIGAVASIGYYQFFVAPQMTTSTTTTTSSAGCTPATCVNVTIVEGGASPAPSGTTLYGYEPTSITVVIGVNNTVVWNNVDSAPHTATASASDPARFDSGNIAMPGSGGSSFQFTFTVAGTYQYTCSYHPWMHGVVVVKTG